MLITNFPELKSEILQSISDTEPCDLYQSVLNSTTYEQLLRAACGMFAWAYQTIITDDTLTVFPESLLNSYGVYINNTTLTNPSGFSGCKDFTIDDEEGPDFIQEIYFVKNTVSTLNINSSHRYKVYVMGGATLTLNISENSSCDLKVFNNSQVTVTVSDSCSLNIHTNNTSVANIDAKNSSIIFGEGRGTSNVNYIGENDSTANFKMFAKSILNYNQLDLSVVNIVKNNSSIINNVSP